MNYFNTNYWNTNYYATDYWGLSGGVIEAVQNYYQQCKNMVNSMCVPLPNESHEV